MRTTRLPVQLGRETNPLFGIVALVEFTVSWFRCRMGWGVDKPGYWPSIFVVHVAISQGGILKILLVGVIRGLIRLPTSSVNPTVVFTNPSQLTILGHIKISNNSQ